VRKIYTRWTFFNKRVFPFLWFGGIALVLSSTLPAVVRGADPMAVIVPLIMAAGGYLIMRMLIFDLMDEAYLDGSDLVVRKSGEEERVPLSNVINVNATVLTNPERITLTLREPCRFGKEIVFSPPMRLMHLGRHPLAAELIELADAARTNADRA
jgi:hypothetical protein